MFIDSLEGLEQCPHLELNWAHDGMPKVHGYLVECTDGHTYLLFAPDMFSLQHIHAYCHIFDMVKTRMSDHDYDPIRKCIKPALCNEKDEYGFYKEFYAPASEIGKIYLVK